MIQGLWQCAAGMQAQQVRQDVLANNLANLDTPGFKPDTVSFRERLAAARGGTVLGDDLRPPHAILDEMTGGVAVTPRYTDFSAAALTPSAGNPLDVAIDGDGFFSVRTDEGTRFTRNGRFALRADGALVTAAGGFDVLDDAGRPIRIDTSAAAGPIAIDANGTIRQGEVAVARLGVVDFDDRGRLQKAGTNLFDADGARPRAGGADVVQYAYESSGVDPISSLVRMIEATRAYQVNATMISLQDQTLARVVNDVGRLA